MNYLFFIPTDLGACNRAKMREIPKLFVEEERSSLKATSRMSDGPLTTAKNELGALLI